MRGSESLLSLLSEAAHSSAGSLMVYTLLHEYFAFINSTAKPRNFHTIQ